MIGAISAAAAFGEGCGAAMAKAERAAMASRSELTGETHEDIQEVMARTSPSRCHSAALFGGPEPAREEQSDWTGYMIAFGLGWLCG